MDYSLFQPTLRDIQITQLHCSKFFHSGIFRGFPQYIIMIAGKQLCIVTWDEEKSIQQICDGGRGAGGGRGQRPSLLMSLKRRGRVAQPKHTTAFTLQKMSMTENYYRIFVCVYDMMTTGIIHSLWSFCTIQYAHTVLKFLREPFLFCTFCQKRQQFDKYLVFSAGRGAKRMRVFKYPPSHAPPLPPILPLMKQSQEQDKTRTSSLKGQQREMVLSLIHPIQCGQKESKNFFNSYYYLLRYSRF